MPELVTPFGALIIWIVAGYILGSIPFGVLVARVMGLGNLRDIVALLTGHQAVFFLTIVLGVLVYFRHASNIARLRRGTESKIGDA